MWSIMRTTSRPPPSRPSEIAVVRIIATVIVTLRRSPVRTSVNTKLKRIGVGFLGYRGYLAAYAVDAARIVADYPAISQFHDSAAHRVDDRVVVRGHQHRRAGAVDPLQQQHDVLARVGVQ